VGRVPLTTEGGSGNGDRPLRKKIINFSLKMACFGAF